MKKGINIGVLGSISVEDALKRAKEVGFDGIELNVSPSGTPEGKLTVDTSEGEAEKIRKTAKSTGIDISSLLLGFLWGVPLSSSDEEVRKKSVDWTIGSIKLAGKLGAESVLIVPGVVSALGPQPEFNPYDQVWELSTKSIREILPHAEKAKVKVAVENVWNKFLFSPREMREFVDQFNSPWVSCYFDVGNIIPYGLPEDWIYSLGEKISNIHLKDYRRSVGTINGFVNLLDGDVDFPEVMKALRKVGYKGYLTAEFGGFPEAPGLREECLSIIIDRIMKMG